MKVTQNHEGNVGSTFDDFCHTHTRTWCVCVCVFVRMCVCVVSCVCCVRVLCVCVACVCCVGCFCCVRVLCVSACVVCDAWTTRLLPPPFEKKAVVFAKHIAPWRFLNVCQPSRKKSCGSFRAPQSSPAAGFQNPGRLEHGRTRKDPQLFFRAGCTTISFSAVFE